MLQALGFGGFDGDVEESTVQDLVKAQQDFANGAVQPKRSTLPADAIHAAAHPFPTAGFRRSQADESPIPVMVLVASPNDPVRAGSREGERPEAASGTGLQGWEGTRELSLAGGLDPNLKEKPFEQKVLAAMDEDGDLDLPRRNNTPASQASAEVLEAEDAKTETDPSDPADHTVVETLLREPGLGTSLALLAATGRISRAELRALRQLVEQSVVTGIDYRTVGLGWHHPQSRMAYREAAHASTTCQPSRVRAERSRQALVGLARSLPEEAQASLGARIAQIFCNEISAAPEACQNATVEGCLAALEAELLLPLRALNEDRLSGSFMARTFQGDALPAGKIEAKVDEITAHVLDGTFSQWRYSNPTGIRQLEGLSEKQLALWMQPTRTEWDHGLLIHEDAPGELGYFWATKIGGPSHGFDLEGQCLLPLLCNARHKAVLVSDPEWPEYPVGRAHFRLLWTESARPVLWLETINICFDANVDPRPWGAAVLTHCARKAEAMGVILSVSAPLAPKLLEVVRYPSNVRSACDKLVLRPSNAVVEASDFLGDHDWLQEEEEITRPLMRAIYEPQLPDPVDADDACTREASDMSVQGPSTESQNSGQQM
mmetsp:Transcript_102466/g.182018  ORF Transcript_102466/g.182018 Transcript_102466/m.182018 type:complete len:604 (-) Transcript_102466:51-1862(-)|eukprot:CAMPEP_0197622752 /NCGR_PEP_ID=MMETSP1338-20131121/2917_1 /TAXON_ID=43686 ORGANISM="Pelagodinium beii, Strain RCC1491" /NCGR_SAMPLE_ID=MMETSP1338 /ASSEMBLY_ACC=CAM_ASM_000754 /LENGTH=603 /DNA_ID=CAMNT_0043192505 /DNA_START=97 /DNA_END=1908 /DNA_ORIENTATION=-